jgi:hypothetical protein
MASDELVSTPLSRRVDEEHGAPCEGSGAAGILVGSSPAPSEGPVPATSSFLAQFQVAMSPSFGSHFVACHSAP